MLGLAVRSSPSRWRRWRSAAANCRCGCPLLRPGSWRPPRSGPGRCAGAPLHPGHGVLRCGRAPPTRGTRRSDRFAAPTRCRVALRRVALPSAATPGSPAPAGPPCGRRPDAPLQCVARPAPPRRVLYDALLAADLLGTELLSAKLLEELLAVDGVGPVDLVAGINRAQLRVHFLPADLLRPAQLLGRVVRVDVVDALDAVPLARRRCACSRPRCAAARPRGGSPPGRESPRAGPPRRRCAAIRAPPRRSATRPRGAGAPIRRASCSMRILSSWLMMTPKWASRWLSLSAWSGAAPCSRPASCRGRRARLPCRGRAARSEAYRPGRGPGMPSLWVCSCSVRSRRFGSKLQRPS